MNNNVISNSTVNKLYVAHSAKKEKQIKEITKHYTDTEKVVLPAIEPYFYTGKSYSYDSNGGGYQGL